MDTGGSSESPIETKKGKAKTPRKTKESLLKQSQSLSIYAYIYVCGCIHICIGRSLKLIWCVAFAESPAEFFAENKNIAGFDNVSSEYEMRHV